MPLYEDLFQSSQKRRRPRQPSAPAPNLGAYTGNTGGVAPPGPPVSTYAGPQSDNAFAGLLSLLGIDGPPAAAPPQAQLRPERAKVGVPSIVPPEYRRTVALEGQRLNSALEDAGVPLSGPEYLAKLIQFESGWRPDAEGPPIPRLGGVTAKGLAQAIPSTEADLTSRFGLDYSNPKDQIRLSALHAGGDAGYNPLYAGYNPGYSSTDPIPGVASGENVNVRVKADRLKRIGGKQYTSGQVVEPPKPRAIENNVIVGDDNFEDLNPILQRKIVQAGRKSGEPINLNSGFRTYDEQAALYADRANNPNPVAEPGSSRHESGLAFDANLTAAQAAAAQEVGLGQPVPGDPVHWELMGRAAARAGNLASATQGGLAPNSFSGTAPGGAGAQLGGDGPTDLQPIESPFPTGPVNAQAPYAGQVFGPEDEPDEEDLALVEAAFALIDQPDDLPY